MGVGLELDHTLLTANRDSKQAPQRIGEDVLLVHLLDDGEGTLVDLVAPLERLDLLGGVCAFAVDPFEAQRSLDGHLPVAQGFVREDPRLVSLLEGEEGVADALDVLFGQLAVLLAEILAKGLEPLRGIDELHVTATMLRLAIRQNPDVCRDVRVVEPVERQCDDCLLYTSPSPRD